MQLLAEADSLPPAWPIQTTQNQLRYPARPALRSSSPAPRVLAAAPRSRRTLSCASQSASAVRRPAVSRRKLLPVSPQVLKPAQTAASAPPALLSLADLSRSSGVASCSCRLP